MENEEIENENKKNQNKTKQNNKKKVSVFRYLVQYFFVCLLICLLCCCCCCCCCCCLYTHTFSVLMVHPPTLSLSVRKTFKLLFNVLACDKISDMGDWEGAVLTQILFTPGRVECFEEKKCKCQ